MKMDKNQVSRLNINFAENMVQWSEEKQAYYFLNTFYDDDGNVTKSGIVELKPSWVDNIPADAKDVMW